MTKPYETLDLGSRKLRINGIEVTANVRAELYFDEDTDLSWLEGGELEETTRKIDAGILVPTVVRVVASAKDCEDGVDVLCGCLLYGMADAMSAVNYHGMVEQAIACLHDNTKAMAERLSKFYSAGGAS